MDRRWQVSVALVLGMFVVLGAILFFAPTSKRGQTEGERLDPARVELIEEQIAKLSNDKRSSQRSAFSNRLHKLEKAWEEGQVDLLPSDDPIVQWLHVDQGHAIGNGAGPTDKIIDGQIVDVELKVTTSPSILVLTSLSPTTWRVKAEPKSLKAVMLRSSTDSFEGPSDVLLCPRNCGVVTFDAQTRRQRKRFIADQFGHAVDTIIHVEQTQGPIVLSPTDLKWARGYLKTQLEDCERDLQSQLNKEFLSEQPNFQFESLSTELNRATRTTYIARFSLGKQIATIPESSNDLHLESFVRANENTQYGVSFRRLLRRTNTEEWSEIEIPSPTVKEQGVRSVAFDEERNRLLILDRTGRLLAYQLDDESWQVLRSDLPDAIGITYWNDENALIAVEQTAIGLEEYNLASGYRTTLRLIGPDGTDRSQLVTNSQTSMSDPHGRMTNELQVRDGFLIAVQPPAGFANFYPLRSVVRVFDMKDGQLRYEQMVPPAADGTAHRAKGHVEYGDATKFAIYEKKLRIAKEAVSVCSDSNAQEFSKRLKLLSDPLAWCAKQRESTAAHWIQSFGRLATPVRITDTSRPIVLVVSSVLATEWNVELAEGVDLRKVVFIGKSEPSFRGLSESTTIEFHKAQRQSFLRKGVAENLVGQTINTSHSCREYGLIDSAVNIGPENGDWVLEQVLPELDLLITDARKVENADLPEDFRFAHVYVGSSADRYPIARVAECTFRGPINGSYLPNTESCMAAVRIGQGEFAVGGIEGVRKIIAKDGKFEDDSLESIRANVMHIHGMMYDDRNDRLMVKEGFAVYAFQDGKWSTLPSLPNNQAEAWCFDSNAGTFHSFVRRHQTIASVHEISEAGVIVKKRVLPTPLPIDMVPAEQRCFAHCTDQHFIFLAKVGEYPRTKTYAYVLDRETLSVQYKGPFELFSPIASESSHP